jgi:hypothetical protein
VIEGLGRIDLAAGGAHEEELGAEPPGVVEGDQVGDAELLGHHERGER